METNSSNQLPPCCVDYAERQPISDHLARAAPRTRTHVRVRNVARPLHASSAASFPTTRSAEHSTGQHYSATLFYLKAREDGVQDNIIYSATLFYLKAREDGIQDNIIYSATLFYLKAREDGAQDNIIYSATLFYLKAREDGAQDNIIYSATLFYLKAREDGLRTTLYTQLRFFI